MQDIAGCRVVVASVDGQEQVVESLCRSFEGAVVVDRRLSPSHGYRAVHVIVRCEEKNIEVQVRTSLQHRWAEVSEKASDVVDAALKYGRGNQQIQELLNRLSAIVAAAERDEMELDVLERATAGMELSDEESGRVGELRGALDSRKAEIVSLLGDLLEVLENPPQ